LVAAVSDALLAAESAWAGIAHRTERTLERAEAALAWDEIVRRADRRLDTALAALAERSAFLHRGVGHRLDVTTRWLDGAAATVVTTGPRRLRAAERDLDATAAQVRAFDPVRIVERGWSLTRGPDGAVIRSIADVAAGDQLVTHLADGDVRSTVGDVESKR
jgi:exonuclease VII large subunit